MIFDKNQTEFEDCIRERIWEQATRLVPLEITLPYADELKSACKDWYDFNQDLCAGMYENPDRYGLFIDPNKSRWDNKQQADFAFWFVGWMKNWTKNECVLTAEEFAKIKKKFNPKSIEALSLYHGFVIEETGNTVTVRNEKYPDMFVAATEICAAGYENYKVNRDYYMWYCDYRGFANYKRTYQDLNRILSDKNLKTAAAMHDYAAAHKVTPQQCNYFFRVEYKCKANRVYIVDIVERNRMKINISFIQPGDEAAKMIENEIEKYSDAADFRAYIKEHVQKCRFCRKGCKGVTHPKKLFGEILVGCTPEIEIYDPNERDLEYIFRFIDMKTMLIKAGL
jgi:hypothetical protein